MAAPQRDAPRRAGAHITIALFVVLLAAPALLTLAGHAGADADFIYHSELRYPFVAPPVSTGALATGGFERDLERQIGDAFPLRRPLIQGYDEAKFRFGDVASPHVIRGQDGWLFFGDEERRYDDGTFSPSEEELTHLADLYRARAQWCAGRGIAYVFVLAPNKSTVYWRYLPPSVRHVSATAGERLMPLLRERGVTVLDPRAALIAASFKREVYPKGETHWNDAGAYIAYRQIVSALRGAGARDEIAPASITTTVEPAAGDLSRFAGIERWLPDRTVRFAFPARAHPVTAPRVVGDPIAGQFQYEAFAVDDRRLPTAVIVGDSFTVALRRFLAEDFAHTVVMQHEIAGAYQFDRIAVEAAKPRVVIEELVERSLVYSDRFAP